MILFQNKFKIKVNKNMSNYLNKILSLLGFLTKMVISFYKKKKYQRFKKYFGF